MAIGGRCPSEPSRSTSRAAREVVNTEVFRVDRPEALNAKNSYASPTPIVDGDRIYVHFGALGTAALTSSGQILWKTRLDYQSQHGNGGSPALYGDLLIVNCDGNGGDAYVVALDVKTGRTRWKTARRQPADQAYTTPLVIRAGGRDQVVSAGAYPRGCLRSVERQGNLARVVRRRVLERAEAGVRPGPGLHRHRVSAAGARRRQARRHGRHHPIARRLDPAPRRTLYTVADPRRRSALHRQRHRHRDVRRREDRDDPLAAAPGRQLLRLTGLTPKAASTSRARKG